MVIPRSRYKRAKILFVEDEEPMLGIITEMLQVIYSPNSKGLRSLEEVSLLMELEDYLPDVVLLDCNPLRYEEDEGHCAEAGDELYALFVQKKIPVILLTGLSEEAVFSRDVYQADPPFGILSKLDSEGEIRTMIENCLSTLETFQ